MNQDKENYLQVDNLRHKLAGCHLTTSPLATDFSLDRLLSTVAACRIIKDNNRRQVYCDELWRCQAAPGTHPVYAQFT